MPQHQCLRLFRVQMLRPTCRLSENYRATDWRSPQEQAAQLRLSTEQRMCPQLETALVRWQLGRVNSPRPRAVRARDFVEVPTRPRCSPFPKRSADLSLVVVTLS